MRAHPLLVAFALLSPGFAHGSPSPVTLHDTLGDPQGSFTVVGFSVNTGNIGQPADSFVVSGGDYFLHSLRLDLRPTFNQVGGTPDDYVVRFWDDANNAPGNLLESLDVPNSSSIGPGETTLLSAATPVLQDGERYWVSVALPDDESNGLWAGRIGTSDFRASAGSGAEDAAWTSFPNQPPMSLRVRGILVPEPGALVLCGLAGCALAGRRRG